VLGDSSPTPAEICRILNLFNAGPQTELESQALSLVEKYPDSVFAWKLLGTVLLAHGKNVLPAIQNIANLLPDDAEAQSDLGKSLLANGQTDEALASFRKALAIKPDDAELHYNLGNVLRDQGQLSDASACYRRAIDLKPDYAEAHNNLGNVLYGMGQFDDAVASYRRALAIKPADAGAHYNIGNVFRDIGQIDAAITSFRLALEYNPEYAEAHNNLGNIQRKIGRFDEAIACYLRAIEINPNYTQAHQNLGSALMVLGKMELAEKSLNRAIALAPDDVPTLAALIVLTPYRRNDQRFDRLEAVYGRRAELPVEQRIKIDFAMGKAMERIGQYDRAFRAYQEGNLLHYQLHPFDEASDVEYLDKLYGFFNSNLLTNCATVTDNLPAKQYDRIPIFIVGMPRSGTTLIEQILASHPDIHGAGELTLLDEIVKKLPNLMHNQQSGEDLLAVLRKLGQEYLDQVRTLAPQQRFIVDKMPDNFRYLGLIHLMLPQAKIIHAVRDPMDTCFSCYTQDFSGGHDYSYDPEMLGRRYQRYRTLMTYWSNILPSERILDLHYEKNIAGPEREARRLLEHIGLPWNPVCLRFYQTERTVHTASVAQVRLPIYTSSVARWKHFEQRLLPLLHIIQQQKPGYPVSYNQQNSAG
jgi:tetratricopeptide (TPR) repeat protein